MIEAFVVIKIEIRGFALEPKFGLIEKKVAVEGDEIGVIGGVKGRGGSRKKKAG